MISIRSFKLNMLLIWIIIMLSVTNFSNGSPTISCFESERQALLNFKKGINDPANILSSWTSTGEEDCCRWNRVGCDNHTGHVVMLDLRPKFPKDYLSGEISSSLLDLPYLTYLDLSYNLFKKIPDFIGSFPKLTYLNLSWSNGNDKFPYQVGNLSMLQYLDLSWKGNMRIDNIEWLYHLSSLKVLNLSDIKFGKDVDWLKSIKIHPSLSTLELTRCQFPEINHSSISHVNPSNSLASLRLFWNSFNTNPIQSWLSNVSTAIVDLAIEGHQLKGPVPDFFGDMTSLVNLDLAFIHFEGGIPSSFGNLFGLKSLVMHGTNLSGPIPECFGNMISLVNVDLSFNQLEGGIPSSFGNLCQLKKLDMRRNNLSGPLYDILENLSCAKNLLEFLDLSSNKLSGSIPDITEFSSLTKLFLAYNNLNGTFPKGFKHFSRLRILDLEGNQLVGELPSFSKLSLLNELHLANNNINGSISGNIAELSGLQILDLSSNKLAGNVNEIVRELSCLQIMDLSSNKLIGVISEAHLSNFSKLRLIDLSYNLLSLNVSSDWIPPFQLHIIKLRSCKLGHQFPSWLQSQKNFSYLDISNSEISDKIPDWFWSLTPRSRYLNLSFNHIYGHVPDSEFYNFPAVDLSSNLLYGLIPRFLFNTTVINLSNNNFTGSLSSMCTIMYSVLTYINLSNNLLSGALPDCWGQLKTLEILNLENNNLSGMIPSSMGSLSEIITFRLRNNNFKGELPSSLKNCSSLELLDLGENKITGKLSEWIGDRLTSLLVLRLPSNEIFGEIPSTICHLTYIQIIDLSFNNLSGIIPSCLNNLTAMAHNQSLQGDLSNIHKFSYYWGGKKRDSGYMVDYFDYALVMWRGVEQEYGKTLGLLKIIDLSNNNLNGEIPKQITCLLGMISLNLSRNSLNGSIPEEIGQLKSLEVLDLSHNLLSSKIPVSIADISFLAVLDLSSNQLTGRIPTGTQLQGFSASVYSYNLGLCGPPLPKCPGEGTFEDPSSSDSTGKNTEASEEWFERSWLYAGAGVGFFVGFWGFYGSLMISNSWRYTYLQFLNKVVKWFYFS